MKQLLKDWVPPVFIKLYNKISPPRPIQVDDRLHLEEISDGVLKGKKIWVNSNEAWQKDILSGNYDGEVVSYIEKEFDLKGKCVIDIGTHIGFYSLLFAELVGPEGKVYGIEPSDENLEITGKNISSNPELKERIILNRAAVSGKEGVSDFFSSTQITNGKSSMNHLGDADTFYQSTSYKAWGFESKQIQTVTIDSLIEKLPAQKKISLIKMDIEGSEAEALMGAKKLLAKHEAALIIEVHTIKNMYNVGKILSESGYATKIIKKEQDGRCIIEAR